MRTLPRRYGNQFNELPIGSDCFKKAQNRWYRKTNSGWKRRARVMMEEKLGHSIPEGYDVHHKDKDPTNDRESNLELKLHGEHSKSHKEDQMANLPRAQNHPNTELKNSQILEIRRLRENGKTLRYLARKFNSSITCIRRITLRKTWKSVN